MKPKLLIVEDTELDRDLLVQIFEATYEIEVAFDGESAVERVRASSPDLVLMDIGLPGIGGLEAVRWIRAVGATVPIIAVSSHVMPGEREQALGAGCDGFMAKPIDDVVLADMVAGLLVAR
jgi:two-component system cell cycle response regulator DivK